MSDCSTNAFKVPACSEPKTCGNCALHDVCNQAIEMPCVGWREDAQSIEQRHERLADAAVELVWIIEAIRQPVDPVLTVKMARIRHELEALGVSLDD